MSRRLTHRATMCVLAAVVLVCAACAVEPEEPDSLAAQPTASEPRPAPPVQQSQPKQTAAAAATDVHETYSPDIGSQATELHGGRQYRLDRGTVLQLTIPDGPSIWYRGMSGETGHGEDFGYSMVWAKFRTSNGAYWIAVDLVLEYSCGGECELICPGDASYAYAAIVDPFFERLPLQQSLNAWLDEFVAAVQVESWGRVGVDPRCRQPGNAPTR